MKEQDTTSGFETIDRIAAENQIRVEEKKHKALYGSGYIEGEKVILAKPQTFMNLSGESVRELSDYYKIPAENVIVIYDDISLDVGQLRIREKGSAGGHNGIKNIILHLGDRGIPENQGRCRGETEGLGSGGLCSGTL